MRKRKGFTLLETVITIVFIGIVASFTFSSFRNTQRFVLRSNLYSQAMFMALEDVNRGVEVYETGGDFVRITTITNDGDLKLITSTVTGRTAKGELVEVTFVRYGE